MEFIDTDFELNKVMTELESSLRLKLSPDKEVTLSFEPQLPELYIHAERNRISQIIINLATNAIIFTSPIPDVAFRPKNKKIYSNVSLS